MIAATLNPSDKTASLTLSGGNLVATATALTRAAVRSTLYRNTINGGKYYFELTCNTVGHTGAASTGLFLGLAKSTFVLTSFGSNFALAFEELAARIFVEGFGGTAIGITAPVAGDVVGFACDMYSGNVVVSKNGVNNTFAHNSITPGLWAPMVSLYFVGDGVAANFGATAFSYLPAGYIGWAEEPRAVRPSFARVASPRPVKFIGL